jgi:hypothetical protein
VRMAISSDGRGYNFVSHEPVLGPGAPGEWDCGQVYTQPSLVRLPDGRLALPYCGYSHTHNEGFGNYYKDWPADPGGLAWAMWDDGRLAGVVADEVGDFHGSNTEALNGEVILINARTDPGGKVEVELVSKATNAPLRGFNFADCVPFTGDGLWVPLQWKGQADMSALDGQRFLLHFRLTKGKLFGYRIAKSPRPDSAAAATPTTSNCGFKKIVPHGKILGRPSSQPEGTRNIVSYEMGPCFQLDRTHCLLVASMDEQGGPDLCVGNDAFVFEKLSDIKAERAIPVNRPEPNCNGHSIKRKGIKVRLGLMCQGFGAPC